MKRVVLSAGWVAVLLVTGVVTAQPDATNRPAFRKLPTEAWSQIIPADKNLPAAWEQSLFERGAPRRYEGEALKYIGMPVGGVCAGLVYLGGDGKLWWWDIFNRHLNGVQPRQIQYKGRSWHGLPAGLGAWQGGNYIEPVTNQPSPFGQGFALRVQEGAAARVRTMDRNGWKQVTFSGAYPVGTVSYADPDSPVKVRLEAFSPYCPLDFDASSYPATILRYTVENTGGAEALVELGAWLENPVLLDSGRTIKDLQRTNSVTARNRMTMLSCSAVSADASVTNKPDWGSMALAAVGAADAGGSARLEAAPEQSVFIAAGEPGASAPFGKTLVGGVRQARRIPAGGKATFDFVLAWHFANVKEGVRGAETGLYYGKRFKDAADVAAQVAANLPRLAENTLCWRDTWYDSTLPYWFLERIFIPNDCLAATTCFRFADGRFYTYEGIRSCAGHPNHVWHYAQGHARLFPELEQDVLTRVWYGFGFHEDGSVAYRGEVSGASAIDGHCGVILEALRAHQTSTNDAWLRSIWPRVKKSIQYAISRDRDNDGLLDTPMLTTLDEPWHGQIPWVSSLYIAALKAGERMALDMGDADFAKECRERAEKGRAAMDAKLFNGEWFVQIPDPAHPTKLGAYETCHIDQVLGQAWAWQVGLGRVLNADTTRSALRSLWKYNFARNLDAYDRKADPKGRPYYADGEGGLVMTANALGRKVPFGVYSGFACYLNETMNGFEYQAAAHMIAEGLVKEGFAVIKTLDERYDGRKRNPFDEVECGDHYARSMAAHGALIAVSGFEYDGPKGHIGFAPRLQPENFKAPFTAAQGWGTFAQRIQRSALRPWRKSLDAQIAVRHGEVQLRTIALDLAGLGQPGRVRVALDGRPLESRLEINASRAVVTLNSAATVKAGETLRLVLP